MGVAGQRGEEHPLGAPVEVLHRALQVRGVGGQVVHRDGERAERGGDGTGEEVLAAVDPHQSGQAADRTVGAVGFVAGDRGAQRRQDRVAGRGVRSDRDAGDGVVGAVDEAGHPRAHQLTI